MMKEILVYDNQLGYFNLLRDNLKERFRFTLFNGTAKYESRFDAVVFFMHEDIELLDLLKIHTGKVPLILGISKAIDYLNSDGAIYTINLHHTKDGIVKSISAILENIKNVLYKPQKAL